ncbi:MAG: hypothetical protein ACJAS1_000589 [Oleiphilaceae bacterium]|jgi:uncharacterized protein YheU (UPF0270 family)
MIISHTELSEEALNGIMESHALQEGTNCGLSVYTLAEKVEQIKAQIIRKEVLVDYSVEADSVGLISAIEAKGYSNH